MAAASTSNLASATPALRVIDRIAGGLAVLVPLLTIAGPAPADIAASLIAVLFLVRSAIMRDASWLRAGWVQCLLLLWAYTCLRNLFLPGMDGFIRSLVWLRYPVFAAALGFWLMPDATLRRRVFVSLAASVAFLVLDSLLQYIRGTDLFGRAAFPYDGGLRLTGPYSKPRVGITIVWHALPVLAWLLDHARWRWRLAGMALTILSMVAVLASGERMAMLLFGMGLAASVLLLRRGRWLLLFMLVVGLSAGYGLMQRDQELHARQVGATSREIEGFGDSAYGRTWQSALNIARAHPLWGIGSKQFQKECAKPAYGPTTPYDLTQRCPMHAHNMYLEWLVEAGLVGLGLFLAAIACWVRMALGQWRHWYGNALATGLLMTVAIRLFPISVVTSQFVAWSAVPFWLVVGWLVSYAAVRPQPPHNNA